MIVLIDDETIEVRLESGNKVFFNTMTFIGDFIDGENNCYFKDSSEGIHQTISFIDWTSGFKNVRFKEFEIFRCANDILLGFRSPGKHFSYIYEDCYASELLFAVMHYYIFNELKLIKCKHCGKWFAAKSLEFEYCNRISPCYNLYVAGKKVLNSALPCEKAVRTITQKFRDRKNSIYKNWNAQGIDCLDFLNQCADYSRLLKVNPTVETISAYQEYLYSEKMPKQKRPNRGKKEKVVSI